MLYRVLESSPGEQVAAVLTTSDEPPQEFVCPDDVAAQQLAAELYEVSLWLPGPDHLTADPVTAWAWVRRFMGLQRPVP